MSLVSAPRGRLRILGALFLALVGGGVAAVLALSGRTLGPGVRFTVELRRTGALRPTARIKLAGRDVGEVRGMVYRLSKEPGEEGRRRVVLDCFVARPWDREVREGSELFVATPSVLGESWLEIGPARGAPSGPAITEGARLRGSDPPELDEFIGRVYRSLRGIEELLHEHRPALDALVLAATRLSSTLDEVGLDGAHLAVMRRRVGGAIDDARAVRGALAEAAVAQRADSTGQALQALASESRPRLAALSDDAERVARNLEGLNELLSAERQREVTEAIKRLRSLAEAARSIASSVDELEQMVERGDGTVGGLLADQELFDDLHETHRILKHEGWRLIARPKAPPRGAPPPAP